MAIAVSHECRRSERRRRRQCASRDRVHTAGYGAGWGHEAHDARQRCKANNAAGVMRFLQLEWHNHERARNAWDIERAEMKAKIAKQEGEVRSAKRLNDQLDKHIRMLEHALTNERNKNKNGGEAQASDEKKDGKGKKGGVKRASKQSQSLLGDQGYILTLHSPEQAPQLLPRRRLRISRPTRRRPRGIAREVKAIPHKVRRRDHISPDTTTAAPVTAAWNAWSGQRRRLPEPWRCFYGRNVYATASPEDAVAIAHTAKQLHTQPPAACELRIPEHRPPPANALRPPDDSGAVRTAALASAYWDSL